MIPPVFVLVCDEMPERKMAVQAHMIERQIDAKYWKGIFGRGWGLETTLEFAPGRRVEPGHVGLNLGFWNLMQHINALPGQPDDAFIVFEDDVSLPADFDVQLDRVCAELVEFMPDWDVVFLGMTDREPGIWNKVTERVGRPNSRLCRLVDPFGTHAMMYRRRAIPVILDKMRAAERNLDQQLYSRVLEPGHVKWCAVLPGIAYQRTYDHGGTGTTEWETSCGTPPPPESAAVVRAMTGTPPPDELAAATQLLDPYPCMYRSELTDERCRDGRGKTAVVGICARLGVKCHTKPAPFVSTGITACRDCPHRTSIPSPARRERLPIPEGQFNPSIHMWANRLILATRDSWGHSQVALWELKNTRPDWCGEWIPTAIGSYKSDHPGAPRLEDPRLFVAPNPDTGRDQLHSMFNLPNGYPAKTVRVGYSRFTPDLTGIEYTEVFESPERNLYEKNWVPFHDGVELRWVYASKPQHIVRGNQSWGTTNNLPWRGGVIRGGAAPVRVEPGDIPGTDYRRTMYYHFFHGCLKRIEGSVYTVGCTVFEGMPPFAIQRQTELPLLWPDNPAPGEEVVKRYVCWPGGAVAHAGAWFLAIGVDDCHCKIVRIPFATVEAALNDIPEDPTNVDISIRDTMVAHGIPNPER